MVIRLGSRLDEVYYFGGEPVGNVVPLRRKQGAELLGDSPIRANECQVLSAVFKAEVRVKL